MKEKQQLNIILTDKDMQYIQLEKEKEHYIVRAEVLKQAHKNEK